VGPKNLAAWLGAVRGYLVPELIDGEALDRIESLAGRLPAETLAALEVRLRGHIGVDLSVRFLSPESCRRAGDGLRRPALHDLAATWENDSGWTQTVSALWLELDLAHERKRRATGPIPIVCARVEQPRDPTWITGSLFPVLGAHDLTPLQKESVHRILRGLPSTARLLYVFDLFPRGNREIRLEFFGPARNDLLPFVHDIAGEEGTRQAAAALELLGDLDRFHLSLDVGAAGEVSPRLGIDGSYRKLPSREPRWAALFERLVEAKLCTPTIRNAVLPWPGYDSFWTAPERWPVAGGAIGGYCVRSLSHVKLVTHSPADLEAKVYLLFGHVLGSDATQTGSRKSHPGT